MTSLPEMETPTAPFTVLVFVPARPESFRPTVASLRAATRGPLLVAAPDPSLLGPFEEQLQTLVCPSPAAAVNRLWSETRGGILLVSDAVVVPPGFLDHALALAGADLRVGTVSFFSNWGGFLSFPDPDRPTPVPASGQDEVSITRTLRTLVPEPEPAPIPGAAGAAVFLASPALSAAGPIEEAPTRSAEASILDFSLRARRRGFVDLLDPGTFYTRPSDLTTVPPDRLLDPRLSPRDLRWLEPRHPFLPRLLEEARSARDSPLALAHQAARAKVLGLRVLVDGSYLGPEEMGTQTALLGVVAALARREDVAEVAVAVPGAVPPYAAELLSHPKVRVRGLLTGETRHQADIAHRPYQPDGAFDPAVWRKTAARVVVTILDLIAYHVASYHKDYESWYRYRETVRAVVSDVDAVVAISEDVRANIRLERLAADPSRIFLAPLGSDHLTGEEPAVIPSELLARGFAAGDFLLVIGTNYTHKNRDLALQAHAELRRRGRKLGLVLAGAAVPFGSSRPLEAARYGTPSVAVGVGPMAELAARLPVVPADWHPASFADAIERLLEDPSVGREQVSATLSVGSRYTWAETAERLVQIYRVLLGQPPRRGPASETEVR